MLNVRKEQYIDVFKIVDHIDWITGRWLWCLPCGLRELHTLATSTSRLRDYDGNC